MTEFYTLDELAEKVKEHMGEDSYAEAGRRVNDYRDSGKEVDRSHVHKALNTEKKTKYKLLLGELAAVYCPDLEVDTSTPYFPAHGE